MLYAVQNRMKRKINHICGDWLHNEIENSFLKDKLRFDGMTANQRTK